MVVKTLEMTMQIPWAQSLKDKRMIVKSLVTKVRGKFNVSIAEVAEQDIHQTAVIGVACVAADNAQADSILDHVLCYIENRSDGELSHINRELR